jgi:hypothetical protein
MSVGFHPKGKDGFSYFKNKILPTERVPFGFVQGKLDCQERNRKILIGFSMANPL